MAALNQKGFVRKLQHMSAAQDSVQTLSLWIIHHKKYANDIVKVWFDQLKKCNSDRRLVMLYLANDVLQNSRKKGKEFSSAFAKVLRETVPLLSDKAIRDPVQRVLQIWQDRKVFESDFVEDLRVKLSAKSESTHSHHSKSSKRKEREKAKSKAIEKEVEIASNPEKKLPPADFKPSKLIGALKAMRDFEAEVTLQESQLNSLRIDASDMEAIKQLKDRSTGAKFTQEYESALEKLGKFCEILQREKEERSQLISVVQDGDLYYDVAYGEVKVIVHAYKTFGNRLNSLKKKLDHKVDKIVQAENEKKKLGPVTTPQASFLSSGLPEMTSDTPVASPKQEEKDEKNEDQTPADTTIDNTEVADMELDDDSDSEKGEPSEASSEEHKTSSSAQDSPVTTAEVVTPQSVTSQTVVSSIQSTAATCVSTPIATVSSAVSTVVATTSTVPVVVPAQLQSQAPMILQRPPMQFMPGQPGIPMMPIGMPGQGTFLPIGPHYGQHMMPFGIVPGMTPLQGAMGQPMAGVMPGQIPLHTMQPGMMRNMMAPQMPSQTPMQGTVHGMPGTQNIIPGSIAAGTAVGVSGLTPPSLSLSVSNTLQVGSAPLAQQAAMVTPATTTNPTQAVSAPLVASKQPSTELYSPTRLGSISPSSEASAPSPVGSPELELGGDETPETASPREVVDMKIIGFPTTSSFLNQESANDSTASALQKEGDTAATSEEASMQSTNTPGTPNPLEEMSKPVSAVDILHRLLKRGKKANEDENTSGTSTPVEEALPTPPPQQPPSTKPLLTLIDSLFPKLSDSLSIIKAKEKENGASTSTSEEGSPEAKIELNPADDDDSETDRQKEEPSTEEEDHDFGPHFQQHPSPHQEGPIRPPLHNGPYPGQVQRLPFNQPWQEPHVKEPPSPQGHPGYRFPGPPQYRPPFEGQRKGILKSPKGGPYGGPRPDEGAMSEPPHHVGPPRGGFSPRSLPPEEHGGLPHEGLSGGPSPGRRLSEEPVSPHMNRGPPFANGPRPAGRPLPEERPYGMQYQDGPRRASLEGPRPVHPGPPGRPPYEPGRPPFEPGRPRPPVRPPFDSGRPPYEPGRPGPPGRPPYDHERPLDEHGRPRFEPEGVRPGPPGRPHPYEPGRPDVGRGYHPGERSPRGFVMSPGFERREDPWRERFPPCPGGPHDRRGSAPETFHDDESNLWTSFEESHPRFPEVERWEEQTLLGMPSRRHSEGGEFPHRDHFLQGKRPAPPFPHYPGPPKRPYY